MKPLAGRTVKMLVARAADDRQQGPRGASAGAQDLPERDRAELRLKPYPEYPRQTAQSDEEERCDGASPQIPISGGFLATRSDILGGDVENGLRSLQILFKTACDALATKPCRK